MLVLLGIVGWKAYESWRIRQTVSGVSAVPAAVSTSNIVKTPVLTFKCDGRTYCSQMTSCQEATYFLKNCPTAKMDGDNDGVPCEQQLCR
ncbi:hypothetical protein GN316_05105 [Xylophilus sp. Kf1]|nr:hypothetical protein [Xylophilus sp. Kf1]